MINLSNVTYTYPRGERPALAEMSFEVPPGQFCAVIGANGAGKSTLCYGLAGFIPQFYRGHLEGSITVNGINVEETKAAELAGTVGLVFSNPFNQITGARFSVFEEIGFGLENMGVPREEMIERINAVMALAGLGDLAERPPYALSGGQQQRLAIASVLVMAPKILVLDEPTSQLDPLGSREVFALMDQLAGSETTVLLTSHKLEWVAEFADRVIMLADGRVVADGRPDDILASPDLAQHGIAPTRYTQAALAAGNNGLTEKGTPLPVTLDEAVAYFQ